MEFNPEAASDYPAYVRLALVHYMPLETFIDALISHIDAHPAAEFARLIPPVKMRELKSCVARLPDPEKEKGGE